MADRSLFIGWNRVVADVNNRRCNSGRNQWNFMVACSQTTVSIALSLRLSACKKD